MLLRLCIVQCDEKAAQRPELRNGRRRDKERMSEVGGTSDRSSETKHVSNRISRLNTCVCEKK
jgi:hypothetical protein